MSAPYTARCSCGSVSAAITGEPLAVRLCWCRQCQQIGGGGSTTNAVFQIADIELSGSLSSHSFPVPSGNRMTHYFCPVCGTHVYGQSSARTQMVALRLGFLDVGHGLKPDTSIWTEEAPDWAVIDPTLPRFDRQTPPPTTTPPVAQD